MQWIPYDLQVENVKGKSPFRYFTVTERSRGDLTATALVINVLKPSIQVQDTLADSRTFAASDAIRTDVSSTYYTRSLSISEHSIMETTQYKHQFLWHQLIRNQSISWIMNNWWQLIMAQEPWHNLSEFVLFTCFSMLFYSTNYLQQFWVQFVV